MAAVFSLLVMHAGAQTAPPVADRVDRFELLANHAIAEELDLETEQLNELADLRLDMQQALDAAYRRIKARYEGKAAHVLLPHQSARLEQIALQMRGIAALADDDLAHKLNFTEAQRQAIASKLQAGEKKFAGLRGKAGRSARERFERLRDIQAETEAAILSVLSDAQRKRYAKLRGQAFDQKRMYKVRENPKEDKKQ